MLKGESGFQHITLEKRLVNMKRPEKRTRIEEMERLINQIANNDEFDEEIFKCIIDTITIEKTRMINFKFRCGIEIEETI